MFVSLIREKINVISFVGVLVGVLAAYEPRLTVLPLAVLFGVFMCHFGLARFLYVTFGSLFVFQSEGFGFMKLGFLIGLMLVVVVSILNVRTFSLENPRYKLFEPLLLTLILFACYLLMNFIYSTVGRHVSVIDAIRDIAPYMLFASAPIIALDIAITVQKKWLFNILMISGFTATFNFSYAWVSRRGLAETATDQLGLASFMIPAAFFSYCCARALLDSQRRFLWTIAASLVIAGILITGTRSTIVFLVAPVVVALLADKTKVIKLLRTARFFLFLLVLVFFSILVVTQVIGGDNEKLTQRLTGITVLVNNDQLTTDASYQDRRNQTHIASKAFSAYPVLGVGAGAGYSEFSNKNTFAIDSPFSFPAKFGIAGLVFLFITFLGLLLTFHKIKKIGKKSYGFYALAGFVTITSCWLVLGPPFEDKGFFIGLFLLLGVLFKDQLESE